MSEHRDTLLLYLRVNNPGRNTKGIFNKCLLISVCFSNNMYNIILFYKAKKRKKRKTQAT